MAVGDDFKDDTPPPNPNPKKHWIWPPPDGTGRLEWKPGETLQGCLARELPIAVKQKIAPASMTIFLRIDVTQD